jgi:hypothetical protein
MCKFLFIVIPILLLVGPIRRWFFAGAWRLLVPLVAGFLIGVPLAAKVVGLGAPREVMIVAPIFASLIITGVLKTALDDIWKSPKG